MSSPVSGAAPEAPASETPRRLQSLDACRGMIMFLLLCGGIFQSLRSVPGWHWLAVQNEHVEWKGCVFWDLIQPSFMFMVGVAMPFSYGRRLERGDSLTRCFLHALQRAAGLIALGILLDHFGADRIQIGFIRVLQQIALASLIAFWTVGRSLRTQAVVAVGILVLYQLAWMFNPWNGPGGPWAMGHDNLGSAFDQWLIGRNYSGYYVGLNAIPSAATLIFGVIAGTAIRPARSDADRRRVLRSLAMAGGAGLMAGLAASPWFPLIKRLWTPSFTVYAGGWTTLFLAAFYGLIEVNGWHSWSGPLQVVGMNSTMAYVLGNAFGGWFRSLTSAWLGLLRPGLGEVGFPIFQHAAFALGAWTVLWWMHRRRLYVRL